ncbi:MAG: SRPBCC family protein [Candidatus Hermodarchaeota archaeon]
MPKRERKIEIDASAKRVFDILSDGPNAPKWNVTVDEYSAITDEKAQVKTTVGDMTATTTEAIENKKITMAIEGSFMTAMGYIITPKGGGVEVTVWGEYEDEEHVEIMEQAGEVLLESLKKYAEYLEAGGNPDEYQK